MKIRESKELRYIANAAGRTTEDAADVMIEAMIKNGIIYEDPEIWGQEVGENLERGVNEPDVTLKNLVDVVKATGIETVTSRHIEALTKLVLMGNGDCPECGGEMEVIDGAYDCTGGDGYYSEREYSPIWETRRCLHCGHVVSSEP